MKKLLLANGFLFLFISTCLAESLIVGTPVLETQLSTGNLPTQRVLPGTENVEVLRIWLTSSLHEKKTSLYSESILLKKLKFQRISEDDRDQILRYKLQYQNRILAKISLPDSDFLEFKNLNLEIPYEKTFELKVLADISSGEISGTHQFAINSPDFLTTENKDVREPKIFIQGKFPIEANKILIGQNNSVTPPEDCNLREEPVCGVDGKTYFNLCIPFQKGIEIDYEGACEKTQPITFEPCAEEKNPVCGNNGNTYTNRCFLDRSDTLWSYNGECFPSDYERPKTYKTALELYNLKANELLQLRPRISDDSTEKINIISNVLTSYNFTFDSKEFLVKAIGDFLDFSQNNSSRTRLEQEIENLRIAIIRTRVDSAREKFEQKKIPFLDVDESEWFFQHVQFLKDKEWVSGYQNLEGEETGLFEPANFVTNAEITKMAFKASGIYWDPEEKTLPENSFAKGHWAEQMIHRAEDLEITLWEDLPNPEKKVDRDEVIQLLFEVFEVIPPQEFSKDYFPDVPQTHAQYRYIQFAKELDIINGYPDGTFLPNASISRAEVAKVLKLAFEKLPKTSGFEVQVEETMVETSKELEKLQMFSVSYISPNFHFYMNIPGLFRFQSFEAKENEIMRFGFAKNTIYDEADINFWLKVVASEALPEKPIYKKSGNNLTIDFPRDRYEKTFFRLEGPAKYYEAMNFLQKSIKYSNPEEDPSFITE